MYIDDGNVYYFRAGTGERQNATKVGELTVVHSYFYVRIDKTIVELLFSHDDMEHNHRFVLSHNYWWIHTDVLEFL